ncbi:MAG: DUF5004 domain-containing protein [Bacteroidetes bacterium]|nr:DUF5004 domain-containing protein [Bacteroidota bacterium]
MKKICLSIISILLMLALMFFDSCKKDEYELGPTRDFVNLMTGTWKVTQVIQIDEYAIKEGLEPTTMDRTNVMNFTDYQITFNSDGSNPATFVVDPGNAPNFVDDEGTWKLDNYNYPTTILLTKTGASEPTSRFALTGPPRKGVPLMIRFERYSQGVLLLSYEYTLTKQ